MGKDERDWASTAEYGTVRLIAKYATEWTHVTKYNEARLSVVEDGAERRNMANRVTQWVTSARVGSNPAELIRARQGCPGSARTSPRWSVPVRGCLVRTKMIRDAAVCPGLRHIGPG